MGVIPKSKKIRNPDSTRPWQHVLEPLSGYIALSYFLDKNKNINGDSFNFGPRIKEVATVRKSFTNFSKILERCKNLNFIKKIF